MNQQTLSLSIVSLSKNVLILNKPLSDNNSFSVKSNIATEQIATTPTLVENLSAPCSSAPEESRVFSKSHDDFTVEQIKN